MASPQVQVKAKKQSVNKVTDQKTNNKDKAKPVSDEVKKAPVLFLSHGAGPCFFYSSKGSAFEDIDCNSDAAKWYKNVSKKHNLKPKAIVIASAHWETKDTVCVQTKPNPGLYFDYSGFPESTYKLSWKAKGSKALSEKIMKLLKAAGIKCAPDNKRGYDHGAFVPGKLVFPEPTVPVVQISILSSLNAGEHFRLGQALSSLRTEGILLLGSGQVTHGRTNLEQTKAFVKWVTGVLESDLLSNEDRVSTLCNFLKEGPFARQAHPRTEHFMPLLFCLGAAGGDVAKKIYDLYVLGGSMSLGCYKFT